MKYEYHTRFVAEELRKLTELAQRCLIEYGPGTLPDAESLHEQFDYVDIPPAVANGLREVAAMVAADTALTSLYSTMRDMPCLHEHHDKVIGAMQALIFLGATADARAAHAAMGIPEKITRDTFTDANIALNDYARNHDGALGMDYTNWLIHHYTSKLFKVGRLQYILKTFDGDARVFVNNATSEVIVTAKAGVAFRGDGLIDGQNGIFSPENRWVSECDEDERQIVTNCLFVNGRAVRTPVVLDKNIWRIVLEAGMNVLDVHVPERKGEEGRLTRSVCMDSLRAALHFFDQYFPDRPIETFYCGSWLLDVEMQSFLPPLSGIVQFQKLFHLYPAAGSDREFIYRAFDIHRSEVNTALDNIVAFAQSADRSTSLRRGIADHWLSGGRLHPAAGVIHRHDLP
ncbi:MAG: acyltransferase domain-containing protein [Phycisphaerales bacterium]|nr:acyltransferase domain-containing protein [Phycisphaerales bacterium]